MKTVKWALCLTMIYSATFACQMSAFAETYYPVTPNYTDPHYGYDPEPCGPFGDGNNKFETFRIGFPDIKNYDRKVISAKLYVRASYDYVRNEKDDPNVEAIRSCDPNLFNRLYSISPRIYMPDNTEVEIDVPLSNFECGDKNRSYVHRFLHYKTSVYNQFVYLRSARLEIIFGSACTSPPAPLPAPQNFGAASPQFVYDIPNVQLHWKQVPGETHGYNIYWSKQSGVTTSQFEGKIITGVNVSSYFQTEEAPGIPLSHNTTYYYIITAENEAGEGAASDEVQVTTGISPAIVPIISLILN